MRASKLKQLSNMLRTRLQQITDTPDVSNHGKMLDALQKEIPHSIRVLSGPNDCLRYNCVMHAFGIERDREYINAVRACPKYIHGNKAFVQELIHQGDLVDQDEPMPALLAIYFRDGAVEHIGQLVSETRVASKWGIGLLYEHEIFDVPSSYGDDVKYFNSLKRDRVVSRFIDFARDHGVRFVRSSGQ